MSTQQSALDDSIESLRLHIRSLQRAGLRFDAAGRTPSGQLSRAALLASLSAESADCQRCRLCNGRTQVVFGQGDARARLMLVGGAPDSVSDAQGSPFADESGELLTRIIEAIKLQRSQVYLTTAVKCLAPPEDPGDDAISACLPILRRQIDIIQPAIICALGPAAARALQEPGAQGAAPRGSFYRLGTVLVMPTHHPELLLRRPELKNQTWIDVQRVQRELESHPSRKD